jgi:surface polysaccharide O-acyltransferase-like enzyme
MKVLSVLILLIAIFLVSNKSTFYGLERLLTDCYSCNSERSIPYPSGNVLGNYLGLSDIQKQELKRKFVEYANE